MKFQLFDRKIILNSFRISLKNKFSLIWIGIMTPIIIAILFCFALIGQGKANLLGYSILAISLSVLITVLVWEIVNLNFLFSSNREIGIMNLEIRKGRTNKEIFFSRLLVNKVFSYSYILLMMVFFLIIYAIFNSRDLTLFWIFLTFIPTDLFLTAVFLFFMAFGRYKLGIALTSMLLTLIALTPFLQFAGWAIISSHPINIQRMVANYSANQVLVLANNQEKENDSTSFTYELLQENKLFNEIIDTQQFENNENAKNKINSKITDLIFDGLLFDSSEILNKMWKEFPEVANYKKSKDFTIKNEIKNTLLFKINHEFAGKHGSFAKDYEHSFYSTHQVTNSYYQSMIKNLKNLIEKINQQFGPDFQQVAEFNQVILNYAQGMLFNNSFQQSIVLTVPQKNNEYWKETYLHFSYQDYLQRMNERHFFDLEWGKNRQTSFAHLSIPPELRLWNEIAIQLITNALDSNISNINYIQNIFVPQKVTQWVAFIPWATQYETWVLANPNLGFYDYYRLESGKFLDFGPWYWIWNDQQYYNDLDTGENDTDGKNQQLVFKPLATIKPTNFANEGKITNFKSFSIVGYELAMTAISISFIGFAFWIFSKKLKK